MVQDHGHSDLLGRNDQALQVPSIKVGGGAVRASGPAGGPIGRPCHRDVTRPDDLPDDPSMPGMAVRYLSTEVFGVQADNTFDAKTRDLEGFVRWFVAVNGHTKLESWMPRDTQAFLNHLEAQGKAPATVNRVFATIRHFARWVQDLPGGRFALHGLPTRGIKELTLDEPSCKKLSRVEIHRLFKAADELVLTETKATQRPRRNRALLSVLYHTGMRVSELIDLGRDQYDGRNFLNLKRKGKGRTKKLYIAADAREAIDEYLAKEWEQDWLLQSVGKLFLGHGGKTSVTRFNVASILERIAKQAAVRHGKIIDLHPHRLRHTFAAEFRDKTNSDSETARALGHASTQYVGRYVRMTDEEREKTIDGLFR